MAAQKFLRLAGDPLRWALLGELARSDRQVQELTSLLGRPQNLVSYHLAKLRSAGLVSARRSSADGRDTYYAVDLPRFGELLAEAGQAVHPGVHLVPAARDTSLDDSPVWRARLAVRRDCFLDVGFRCPAWDTARAVAPGGRRFHWPAGCLSGWGDGTCWSGWRQGEDAGERAGDVLCPGP